MKKLSVIILIPENQRHSPGFMRAMRSAQFADEVLVVSQKSPIQDFAQVRNDAMEKAKGEWVFFLDSDEEVTAPLVEEVQQVLKGQQGKGLQEKGFSIKRRDIFLGNWLKHGETSHVRLFRLGIKDAGQWERPVHEVWKIDGIIGELKEPLLHYSHQSVDNMMEKIDRYSGLDAQYRYYNQSDRTRYNTFLFLSLVLYPAGKFIQNYFFRLGFLDGIPGFIHAAMMSMHSFLVRAKYWQTVNSKW